MSDLTDLEICKRIAEIEALPIDFVTDSLVIIHNGGDGYMYNPLPDDALCLKLAFKYEVCINHYSGTVYIDSDYTDKPPIAQVSFDGLKGMKKAILLAIIEANKNEIR